MTLFIVKYKFKSYRDYIRTLLQIDVCLNSVVYSYFFIHLKILSKISKIFDFF